MSLSALSLCKEDMEGTITPLKLPSSPERKLLLPAMTRVVRSLWEATTSSRKPPRWPQAHLFLPHFFLYHPLEGRLWLSHVGGSSSSLCCPVCDVENCTIFSAFTPGTRV